MTLPHRRRLLVLKIGTSTIMEPKAGQFSLSNLGRLVDTVCSLKENNYQVVIVSSGAVGAGVIHLKLKERPGTLQGKQAASAVGQCRMMRLYEDLFAVREQKVAQIILTRYDVLDRARFVNFKNTLKELLKYGVLPIINENDTIATDQLRFGDNDTLAAYVAISLDAECLFLLTDVDYLYTSNPRIHSDALPISVVRDPRSMDHHLTASENQGTAWGTGGMRTKLIAANIATATGIHTALCSGIRSERISDILSYIEGLEEELSSTIADAVPANTTGLDVTGGFGAKDLLDPESIGHRFIGTLFLAQANSQRLHDNRRWILSLPVRGRVVVDNGAALAVMQRNKSLFAAGIMSVEGQFVAGESVSIFGWLPHEQKESDAFCSDDSADSDGTSQNRLMVELARGLVNFDCDQLEQVKGMRSELVRKALQLEHHDDEVIHRHNIIFLTNPLAAVRRIASEPQHMFAEGEEVPTARASAGKSLN